MTTEATSDVAAGLDRVRAHGPLRGLRGLTAAELRRWFPWRALVLAVLGTAWVVGFFLLWLGPISSLSGGPRLTLLLATMFAVLGLLLVLAMIGAAQGAMANELEDGTAAWVVAKPVGRPAFVLAKFLAAIPGVVIGAVVAPGVVARFVLVEAESRGDTDFTADEVIAITSRGERQEEFTTLPTLGRYSGSLVLIAAILIFVVAVMILLGTVVRSRAAIFLAGVAVPIAMLVYGRLGPEAIVGVLPAWAFDSLVEAILDEPAPVLWPAVVTFLWSSACVGIAMWWFSWKEL